jgi:hypothetical protein
MSNPSFTQVTSRVRNDDGNETTATWRQTQGTNDTVSAGQNFRVRLRIDETASVAWTTKTWNLRYSQNGGAYALITTSTPVQLALSSQFANGDDCTTQLTGGTGTFVTDNNGMRESTFGTNSGSAGNLFEIEANLKFDTAQVAAGDTFDFRVYDSTSAIAVYTVTVRVTVGEFQRTSTDTGSAADARSLSGDTSNADTGSAADTQAAAGSVTAADTASAADALSSVIVIAVADTSTAGDSQSLAGTSTGADTSSAADGRSIDASITTGDNGTAVDAQSLSGVSTGADTASASDDRSTDAFTTAADSASAANVQTSSTGIETDDAGTGTDALAIASAAALADTAAGSDSQACEGSASLTDSASGADSNDYEESGPSVIEVSIDDVALAAEDLLISAEMISDDVAAGVDEFLGHIDFESIVDLATSIDAAFVPDDPDTSIIIVQGSTQASFHGGRSLINVSSGKSFIEVE